MFEQNYGDYDIYWMDEKGNTHKSEMFPTTYSIKTALQLIRWNWTDYSKRRYFAKDTKGNIVDPWDVINHKEHLGGSNVETFKKYYPEEF